MKSKLQWLVLGSLLLLAAAVGFLLGQHKNTQLAQGISAASATIQNAPKKLLFYRNPMGFKQ